MCDAMSVRSTLPDIVRLAPLLAGQRLLGVLKSYNTTTGFGFIACSQTASLFHRDIFIQRREVELCGASVGATISFTIELNRNGQPQARDVGVEAPGVGKSEDAMHILSHMLAEVARDALDRSYVGFLQSFNVSGGSVSCDETLRIFGREVFVPAEHLQGLTVGDAVSFRLDIDLETGFPRARDLVLTSVPAGSLNPDCAVTTDTSSSPGVVPGVEVLASLATVGLEASVTKMTLANLSFMERGQTEFAGLEGMIPQTMLQWIQDQEREKARKQLSLRGPSRPSPWEQLDLQRRYVGIIRTFNCIRGFGFIACDETFNVFGSDVFLHNEQRERFEVGDVVSFALEPRGTQVRARDLRPSSGPRDTGERTHIQAAGKPESDESRETCNTEREFRGVGLRERREERSRSRSTDRKCHRASATIKTTTATAKQ